MLIVVLCVHEETNTIVYEYAHNAADICVVGTYCTPFYLVIEWGDLFYKIKFKI